MAQRVLEGLPELIEAERRFVYTKGRLDAEAAILAQVLPKPLPPHRPAAPRVAARRPRGP
jgi:hypothetical protein